MKLSMTWLAGLAALVLVAGGVTWWLVGRDPSYCDQVSAHTADVEAGKGTMQNPVEGLPALKELAAAAPSDIKDEWQVVLNAVRGLQQAFDATGVDPNTTDISALPDSVTPEQRQRLRDAASRLLSPEVKAAIAGIDQEVRDVCHTPLQL